MRTLVINIKRALQDSWTFYIYTASMVIGKVCFINDHNKPSRTFCLFLSRQLTFTVTGYDICTVPYTGFYKFSAGLGLCLSKYTRAKTTCCIGTWELSYSWGFISLYVRVVDLAEKLLKPINNA